MVPTTIFFLIRISYVYAALYAPNIHNGKLKYTNVILTATTPSLISCTLRCHVMDKEANVLYEGESCTCIKVGKQAENNKEISVAGSSYSQVERKEIKEYALQKPSMQSSLWYQNKDNDAFNANDGKLDTIAKTSQGYDYWEVDLQAYIWITEIRLIMTQHLFDKGTITDLYLYTRENTNDPKDRLCKKIGTPSSIYITVTCDTFTKARFVRLKKNIRRVMFIADVKVFGYEE